MLQAVEGGGEEFPWCELLWVGKWSEVVEVDDVGEIAEVKTEI